MLFEIDKEEKQTLSHPYKKGRDENHILAKPRKNIFKKLQHNVTS